MQSADDSKSMAYSSQKRMVGHLVIFVVTTSQDSTFLRGEIPGLDSSVLVGRLLRDAQYKANFVEPVVLVLPSVPKPSRHLR